MALACWGYAVAMIAVLLALRIGGDEYWLATVLLYGPRAFYIVPLALLVPAAWFGNRRCLFVLLIPAALWAGPIMGLCLPWARLTAPADGPIIRMMSYNLCANEADQQALGRLLEVHEIDVAVYQESANVEVFLPPGWHKEVRRSLTILSRWPIRDVRGRYCHVPYTRWPPVDCLAATLDTEYGPIDVVTVHFRTPRWGLEDVLDRDTVIDPSRSNSLMQELYYRDVQSRDAREWISRNCQYPTIVAGDFNLVPDGRIYRRHWSDLTNAYSVAGFGYGYTRWSHLPLEIHYGARIDHILFDEGFAATSAEVGLNVGSDHLPVVAVLKVLPRAKPDPLEAILASPGACLCLRDCRVDSGFNRLANKPGITTVAIEHATATEDGIRALATLPDLENLYLETSSPLTASDLGMLRGIPRLRNLALLGIDGEEDLDSLAQMGGLETLVLSAPQRLQPDGDRAARTNRLITLFGEIGSLTHVLLMPEWAPLVDESRLQAELPEISLRILAPINGFRFDALYREPRYIQSQTDAGPQPRE